MKVSIEHRPSYALGVIDLASGESVQAETGAMVSMSAHVGVTSSMQGGLLKSALRKVLGGESFFMNTFTATGAAGQVTVAPSLPGDIEVHELSGEIYVQSGSFLAGGQGVDVDIKWGGARSFFSSEGLFLLRVSGAGAVLMSSFGAIRRLDLDGDDSVIIDTGHIVAFDAHLDWRVKKVSGLFTSMISGEGLVAEFGGKGSVWLQTRSNQAFLDWLLPRLPTARTASGGRGDVGGIIGNVLGGR